MSTSVSRARRIRLAPHWLVLLSSGCLLPFFGNQGEAPRAPAAVRRFARSR